MRVSDRGGRPTPLTTLDRARGEYSHRWPDALPGGSWVLFTVGLEDASFDDGADRSGVAGDGRTPHRRCSNAGFARYLPSGRLLFVRGGRLYVGGFDPDRLAIARRAGSAASMACATIRATAAVISPSRASGVLIYGPGVPSSLGHYLAWVDRDGPLQRVVDTPRPFRDPRVEPGWTTDGDRVGSRR